MASKIVTAAHWLRLPATFAGCLVFHDCDAAYCGRLRAKNAMEITFAMVSPHKCLFGAVLTAAR
jgi:hypothetical protein